jgi:predicted HicB family RNase H-like nuclease
MAEPTQESNDQVNEQSIHELRPDELAQYYDYRIQYSQDDEAYVGSVVEWPSLKAYGESQGKALDEIKKAVELSIEDCREAGDDYPEPFNLREFSGRFSVRIQPSLHRELTKEAQDEGVSLNQLVTRKLSAN